MARAVVVPLLLVELEVRVALVAQAALFPECVVAAHTVPAL